MHFLAKISIPNDAGNKFVSGKDFNQKMDMLMAELKPETAYFASFEGKRTILAVINIQGSHEIARVAEPFWLAMSANVELTPIMTQEDFAKAGPYIKQSVDKYAMK